MPEIESFNLNGIAALGRNLTKWSKEDASQNSAKHVVGPTCGNFAHVSIVPIDS